MLTIKDFTDFFHHLERSVGKMPEYNEHVSHFRNMVGGLGGGCGCNRKQRISHCEAMYRQMCTHLTEEDKNHIKAALNVDGVELAEKDEVFCSF